MTLPTNHEKKTLLSAITPSNNPTLGNYIGAIKNWVQLQHEYDCLFIVADLHAITVKQDPKELRARTYSGIANYIAAGLNPEQVTLFVQSHVAAHAELAWALTCFTNMGELSRMTQFKDKSAKQGAAIPAGLFSYPVLMAADILLYQTHLVPVGEDQKQHVELTRDIAGRMNGLFGGDLFRMPEPYIPKVGARIMSLQDPTAKMSKSDPDPNGPIYLQDSNDVILKKLKRAVTDSGTEITDDEAKPGVRNLLMIQSALTGKPLAEIVESYKGKMYGHLKVETAEIIVQAIGPIRDKTNELLSDLSSLDKLLHRGAERARERAAKTVAKVYERVGFIR